jgi:hypothetical protein
LAFLLEKGGKDETKDFSIIIDRVKLNYIFDQPAEETSEETSETSARLPGRPETSGTSINI